MNKIILILASIIFFLTISTQAKVKQDSYTFKNAKYLETYDGDTFYVDIPSVHPIFGKRLGIRIGKIDTPEIRSKNKYEKELGYKAKSYTKKILEDGKKLILFNCIKGSFSRIVCDVKNSLTEDLGADLIKNGHAEIYER
jgi:endonuclease YncB( thermonuclease family)